MGVFVNSEGEQYDLGSERMKTSGTSGNQMERIKTFPLVIQLRVKPVSPSTETP